MSAPTGGDDAVLAEVVRRALAVAVEEASIVVVRSSHSAWIQEGADAAAALLDASGGLVAQSSATSLLHGASLRCGLQALLADIGLDELAPGDVVAHNDPYRGGIHANDILVFRPIFVDGAVRWFAGSVIHVADLGGVAAGGLAALATDTFAEGVLLPPLWLHRAGEPVRDVLRIIERNSRAPEKVLGDVGALVAGVNVLAQRVGELVDRYGVDELERQVEAWIDYAERRLRDDLRRLPPGTHRGRFTIDTDGLDPDRHLRRRRRPHRGGRPRHRRLRRHLGPVRWRHQLVVVPDALRRGLRGAVLRRPRHPHERGLLPGHRDGGPGRHPGEPHATGGVRRPGRHRRCGRRRPAAGAGRRRPRPRRGVERAHPRLRAVGGGRRRHPVVGHGLRVRRHRRPLRRRRPRRHRGVLPRRAQRHPAARAARGPAALPRRALPPPARLGWAGSVAGRARGGAGPAGAGAGHAHRARRPHRHAPARRRRGAPRASRRLPGGTGRRHRRRAPAPPPRRRPRRRRRVRHAHLRRGRGGRPVRARPRGGGRRRGRGRVSVEGARRDYGWSRDEVPA